MATISSTLSLVDNMTSKLNSIKSSADELITSMEGIGTAVNNGQTSIDNLNWATFNKNCEEAGKKISNVGHKMTLAFTTPILLLGKKMYGASTGYETAFTGMTKTVNDATEEQHQALRQMALNLSEVSPTGFIDLMGTMQTAGNLGVKVDEMENFTRSYTALTAATDKHINGEAGAGEVANFLNIMDKGVGNIERFGSTIVYLGNNFNSTEDKILSMATRMASAADLAGFRTSDVLGMATAFSAVGINAEAGGSAASKMIKEMQLAAEVGRKGQELFGAEYGSAVDFSYYISNKDNLLGIAGELGVTTEYVESLSNSWLSLEQFSQVSGKTAEQFIADWKNNPVQGMIDFFAGLNSLDASGVESTLAMLDKMGITEIRQSNLVAAMATNPKLFADAVNAAAQAYEENTAMWAEYEKQISTQEAQNQMLANKAENVSADLGDNLVEAIQPALDKLNELLTAFNSLSEADQDAVVTAFMIFAATGPICIAVGETVTAIGKISSGIQTLATSSVGTSVVNFFKGPGGWVTLVTAAVVGLIAHINDIETNVSKITSDLSNVQINIDSDSQQRALAAIAEVQAAADKLSGKDFMEQYAGTSEAVKLGYGTDSMYASALQIEKITMENSISETISEYQAVITDLEKQMADAINAGNFDLADTLFASIQGKETERDAAVDAIKQDYSDAVNDLIIGMISQTEGSMEKLESINQKYNLLSLISNFSLDEYKSDNPAIRAAATEQRSKILDGLYSAGLMNAQTVWDFKNRKGIYYHSVDFDNYIKPIYEQLVNEVGEVAGDTNLMTILSNALNANAFQNADISSFDNALLGLIQAMDIKYIADSGVQKTTEIGDMLIQGLANGTTDNVETATTAAKTLANSVIERLQTVLGVHSPSVITQSFGNYVSQGLALGIIGGSSIVNAAMLFMGMGALNTLRSIATHEQGFSIGYQISAGMAAGIRSGQSSVISAARAVAQAAITAAKSTLGIHSPSTVFRGLAVNTGKGYVIGLNSMEDEVSKTVGRLFSVDTRALDGGVWSNIGLFSGLETQQFGADDNDDLKVSDSDMKKIRELAEREVINQFTTAELHVDFTANNNIHSDLDLDGIVSYLEDKVTERLEEVAEGVYQ